MRQDWAFFGRAESVEKLADELDLFPAEKKIRVRQVTAGLTRELVKSRQWQLAAGAAVTYTLTPSGSFGRTITETSNLDRIYGKDPIGFWIFLRLRPAAMTH